MPALASPFRGRGQCWAARGTRLARTDVADCRRLRSAARLGRPGPEWCAGRFAQIRGRFWRLCAPPTRCSAGFQAGMLCLWIYLGFLQGLVALRHRVWLWWLQRRQRHSDFLVLDPQNSVYVLCACCTCYIHRNFFSAGAWGLVCAILTLARLLRNPGSRDIVLLN